MTDFYSETHFTLPWPPVVCDWALRFKAALDLAADKEVAAVADQGWRSLLQRFDDDPPCVGFDLARSDAGLKVSAPGFLCAESLAIFIQIVLQTFTTLPLPPVEFEWANYAYSNDPGAFGGGAAVVSREKITLMTTADWLYRMKIAPPPEPATAITAWLRQLQPNLPDSTLAQQTASLLAALSHSHLPHPAPGFVTTVIAQEVNRQMEQIFDLLSQLDTAFKHGLPTSLSTLNTALELNAGHLNGTITYDQWRALYQPIMDANWPHCFPDEALSGELVAPHHIWTLALDSDNWAICPAPLPAVKGEIYFLTGVPWNNKKLVVVLDKAELTALRNSAEEELTNGR